MSIARKVWIGGFALALLTTAALLSTTAQKETQDNKASTPAAQEKVIPEVGFRAPEFVLPTLVDEKQTVRLSEIKKPVVINFWASWCGPCKQEMPDLESMHQQYGDRVAFYGINLTKSDKIPNIHQAVQNYGITYPVLLDADDSVSRLYQAYSIPTTYAIDANGMIVEKRVGAISKTVMDGMLQRLVATQKQ